MKEIINIYKNNKITIENYIHTLISSMPKDFIKSADKIFKKYNFVQLIYEVDKNYKQTSPIICRQDKKSESIGDDKSHYFLKLKLDNKNIFVSNPYIHYPTGKASVSVVTANNDKYTVFDIDLIMLLEHLKMIEHNSTYDYYKKIIYSIGSTFLSIISITLGLAIFDLAKQIFEHEVLFHTFQHPEYKEYKILGKFLISLLPLSYGNL